MGKSVSLPWGKGRLEIPLPPSWTLLGELVPRSAEAPHDPADACLEALNSSIGAAPLGSRKLKGRSVVLVVDDHSRPTPVKEFIKPVLDELARAGVEDRDLTILIATGVHRSSTAEEVEKKIGRQSADRFRWLCHNAYDSEGLADLGSTSRGTRVFVNKLLVQADLIVCVGSIDPHLLLGFGGGLKMIIPGCAGAETIGRNHLQGMDAERFNYVGVSGDDSPMRLDLEEAAQLLKKDIFIVNAAMNERARPTRFFCGDPVKAQRSGEEFVQGLVRLDVPEPSDVVLTSSFPMDIDLRQSAKCIGNSMYACKADGVIAACLKSELGLGEMPAGKSMPPYPMLRMLLKIIGKRRILPLVEKAKKNDPVEEVFLGNFMLQLLRRNHIALFTDSPRLPPDVGAKMGVARSFTAPESMMTWVASKVPRKATAWVVPFGGASYAAVRGKMR